VHLNLIHELRKDLVTYLHRVREYDRKKGYKSYHLGTITLIPEQRFQSLFNIDGNVAIDNTTRAILFEFREFTDYEVTDRPGELDPILFFSDYRFNRYLFEIPDEVDLAFKSNPNFNLNYLENILYVELVNLQRVFNLFTYLQNDIAIKCLKFLHLSLVNSIQKRLSQYGEFNLADKFKENINISDMPKYAWDEIFKKDYVKHSGDFLKMLKDDNSYIGNLFPLVDVDNQWVGNQESIYILYQLFLKHKILKSGSKDFIVEKIAVQFSGLNTKSLLKKGIYTDRPLSEIYRESLNNAIENIMGGFGDTKPQA
jgi:hypothetical protein